MTGKYMIVSEQAKHIFNELTWITRLPIGDKCIRIPANRIGEYLMKCYVKKNAKFNTSTERVKKIGEN
jgi:hypothetical protein